MLKILYLVRGVPGSGKSTLANKISNNVCEADEFFYLETGTYKFDGSKLKLAHEFCRSKCEYYMKSICNDESDDNSIAVENTFTRKWEMKPYYELAEKYDFSVVEIICNGNFSNLHGVPPEKIKIMRNRFEY